MTEKKKRNAFIEKQRKLGKANTAAVNRYFRKYPYATHYHAAADLGFAICTIQRHYRKFRKAFVAERAARKAVGS